MEFNKKNIRILMGLISFSIVFYVVILHINIAWKIAGFILGLIMPLILGACIAFVLNVPMNFFEKKILSRVSWDKPWWQKAIRPLSIVATFAFLFLLILFLVLLVFPELRNTFKLIQESLPGYIEGIMEWINNRMTEWNISGESLSKLEINWDTIIKEIKSFLTNGGAFLFSSTMDLTTSVISGVVNFFLGIVFAIYILLSKETLGRQFRQIVIAYCPERVSKRILEIGSLSNQMFTHFITGQVMEAVIIGALCFIGMLVLSIPYPLMISVLVGFTALVPVFGAFFGTAIGVFVILMVSPIKALWFVLFILVLQQLEGNLIYPKVVGKSVGLPGMWVMLAVLVGGSLWGAIGMLIGVPISSILYCLLREDVVLRLKKKNVSS